MGGTQAGKWDRRLAERLDAAFAHDRRQRPDCANDEEACEACAEPTETVTATETVPTRGLDTIAEGDSDSDGEEEEAQTPALPRAQDPDTEVAAPEVETVRPSEVPQVPIRRRISFLKSRF